MDHRNRLKHMAGWLGGAVAAVAALTLLSGCSAYLSGPPSAETSVIAQEYPELYDYGNWLDISPWGPVWQPDVGAEWSPFEYGNWLDTDDGWMWSSYEPWGNVVYHYGEWNYDPIYGWYWIPGNTWSPARVRWAVYGDYIGWRPLGPGADHDRGPWVDHDHRMWTVVPDRDFDHDNVGQYRTENPPPINDRDRRVQVFREPSAPQIMRKTGYRPPKVRITKEHRMIDDHRQTIVKLPPKEQRRVEQHREAVARKVLQHRPEPRGNAGAERPHGHQENHGRSETHGHASQHAHGRHSD